MLFSPLKWINWNVTIPWNSVLWHSLALTVYIGLEIVLAGAMSNKFAHPVDYLLHYTLYIVLFYFHCYWVLTPAAKGSRLQWIWLPVKILLELLALFCVNLLIHLWLNHLDITSTWTVSKPVFIYSNIYRGTNILFLSTGYWLALEYIKKQKQIHEIKYATAVAIADKEKLRADMLKIENELLRSQINPHMLFNSFNYLYNEIRKIDDGLAEYILLLAKFTRYSLTAADHDKKVLLTDEVEHLEQYIALHCKRIPSHIKVTKYGISGVSQHKIIPMVLFTLLENVLQHGDLADPKCKAVINVSSRNGLFTVRTKNKVNKASRPGHGIGLDNMRKRLELNYPESFILDHAQGTNYYNLQLTINL